MLVWIGFPCVLHAEDDPVGVARDDGVDAEVRGACTSVALDAVGFRFAGATGLLEEKLVLAALRAAVIDETGAPATESFGRRTTLSFFRGDDGKATRGDEERPSPFSIAALDEDEAPTVPAVLLYACSRL